MWKCNVKAKDVIQNFKPGFWRDVLQSWVEFDGINPSEQSEIKSRVISFNLFMFSQVSVCLGGSRSLSRCNVLKLPPRATLTQSIFNSTKLPHPEV